LKFCIGFSSSFLSQCGSKRIRILVRLKSHKKFNFTKIILKGGNRSINIHMKVPKPFRKARSQVIL
jgi:hypothetical protein